MSAPTVQPAAAPAPTSPRTRPIQIGAVSFLNALPLIDGLQGLRDVELKLSVPSLLLDQLLAEDVDVALCSTIDYQRSPEPLRVVSAGLLGCEGTTLTVRLYSMRPIEEITRVYCDLDSHTSTAMMRILLRELYDLAPEIVDYDAREHVAENRPIDWPETVMLIGDKVVTDSPPAVRYPHQLDLGYAWAKHFSVPFVFAAWMARAAAEADLIRSAAAVLDRQRRYNRRKIDSIIHEQAGSRSWPHDLARSYLTDHIAFEFTDDRVAGLDLFYDKSLEHQLIEQKRPIEFLT